MTTDTKEDVDLENLLADEIPCVASACPNEVLWRSTSPCCGFEAFWCEEHHDREVEVEQVHARHGWALDCGKCDRECPNLVWYRV